MLNSCLDQRYQHRSRRIGVAGIFAALVRRRSAGTPQDRPQQGAQAVDVEFGAAGVAFRGSFLIDKKGVVRHQVVNDLPLGRNVDEMLRMVDALQFTEEHGEVCPAGWNKGKPGMKASTAGVAEYLASHAKEL